MHMCSTYCTDAIGGVLAQMTALSNLDLSSSIYLRGSFLEEASTKLPNLVNFYLGGCSISDTWLDCIAAFTALQDLCLSKAEVRGTGVSRLSATLPYRLFAELALLSLVSCSC